MSSITVQFFARLREQLGTDSLSIPWLQPGSISSLIDAIEAQLGEESKDVLRAPEILVAINQTMVAPEQRRDHQLQASDEGGVLTAGNGGIVMSNYKVLVTEEDFDVSTELDRLNVSGVGGINNFVGVVRNENDDASVKCLRLEHYPGMTEKQILAIIEDASRRFDVRAATVIHRVGDLYPKDQIVFVGVSSAHRGEAFDACEFIIDYLKTRATFWKKEFTPDGPRWLTTRDTDVQSAQQWAEER